MAGPRTELAGSGSMQGGGVGVGPYSGIWVDQSFEEVRGWVGIATPGPSGSAGQVVGSGQSPIIHPSNHRAAYGGRRVERTPHPPAPTCFPLPGAAGSIARRKSIIGIATLACAGLGFEVQCSAPMLCPTVSGRALPWQVMDQLAAASHSEDAVDCSRPGNMCEVPYENDYY